MDALLRQTLIAFVTRARATRHRSARASTTVVHLIGPLWGDIIIMAVAGAIAVACFVAMFWMPIRPGETDRRHTKYAILRDDR